MKNTKHLFGITGLAVVAILLTSTAQAQPRHHHGLPHRDLFVALDVVSLVADILLPRTVVAPTTTSVVVPQTTYVAPPTVQETTYVAPTVQQTTYVQPVVTQPVVTQPVVTTPVVTQPVVTTTPVVTQPVVVSTPSTVVYTTSGSTYYYPRYYTPRFYGPRYIAPPPPPRHGFHGGPGFHGPRH